MSQNGFTKKSQPPHLLVTVWLAWVSLARRALTKCMPVLRMAQSSTQSSTQSSAQSSIQSLAPSVAVRAMCVAACAVVFGGGAALDVRAAPLETNWDVGYKAKARLVVGALPSENGARALMAGVDIVLDPGWKTYWRSPGDAGGIPPRFDWSRSENLKVGAVQFPAPQRFVDSTGTTIGYKDRVVFPVSIQAVDQTRPIKIALQVDYGVCAELCIPARAQLVLVIPPVGKDRAAQILPHVLIDGLRRIPPIAPPGQAKDLPYVSKLERRLGAKPQLAIDVTYPSGTAGAYVLVETSQDVALPLAKISGQPTQNTASFVIQLPADAATLARLKGMPLRLTIVSRADSVERHLKIP